MQVVHPSLRMFGIRTPLIRPGDNIVDILIDALEKQGVELQDNDILVIAESPLATSENRLVRLEDVEPSKKAEELALEYQLDPREMELILQECDEIFGGVPGAALTITDGTLSPNAGIDSSNAPEGYVVLLPDDPQGSAEVIRRDIEKRCRCHVGVIVGDSRTQPLRLGCVGIALGSSGIVPVEDVRGSVDLFAKEMKITRKAVADNLVSAAQLLMGEAGESIPAVLIRGAPVQTTKESVGMPLFSPDECMYYSNIRKQ
ncbi:coenzyme F420-0:L-glutamate ligase [Methanolobus halotolerans]|uniref:Coenzyme F420-0:L-glutamate ligase n=1 Tax=Methanolobus halotolerans TaxID=2052935 RepID=A0A4E0PUX7_9EURY|nr:coenzyme F420-0:L-glutamate ligase [Methanolobus halotolerans]TGC07385.1 coenzyme F420-0:L-glutamate ligase [Methanolobus halotolerans]